MDTVELGASEYRRLPHRGLHLRFFQALSYAIASTAATKRKGEPMDKDRSDRLLGAFIMSILWYFTHLHV